MRSTRNNQARDNSQTNRSAVSLAVAESQNELNESLLNLEVNLRNECEILLMSLKIAGDRVTISTQDDIISLKGQINEEITSYHRLKRQLIRQKQPQQQSSSQSGIECCSEQLNLVKLKFNKLILQIERIIAQNKVIEEIADRFPRSQVYQQAHLFKDPNQLENEHTKAASSVNTNPIRTPSHHISQSSAVNLSKILNKPPAPISSNSFYSNNKSLNGKRGAQGTLTHIEEVTTKTAKSDSMNGNNKEIIKRELLDLKSVVQGIVKRFDSHDHSDYDLEIDRLRKENNQTMHDYKILKNDNTEIMHSLRTLSAIAVEVKNQNEELLMRLNHIPYKNIVYPQQSQVPQHVKRNGEYQEEKSDYLSPPSKQLFNQKRSPKENSRGFFKCEQNNIPNSQKSSDLYDLPRGNLGAQQLEQQYHNERKVLTRSNSRGLQYNHHERQKSNPSILRNSNSFSRQLILETMPEVKEDEILDLWARLRM